jgi:hypothetical protein
MYFNGLNYNDDRMFVLHLERGTVVTKPDEDGIIWTTVYHGNPPPEHIWCLVTYKNCKGYPIARVDHFAEKSDAIDYMREVEPKVPLISLNGRAPESPMPIEEFISWKKSKGFKDYDFKRVFREDVTNPKELIAQTSEQFKGVR